MAFKESLGKVQDPLKLSLFGKRKLKTKGTCILAYKESLEKLSEFTIFLQDFFQMKQDDLKKVNQLHKNFKKQDKLQSFFKKRLERLKRRFQARIDFGGEISSLGGRYVTRGVFPIFR